MLQTIVKPETNRQHLRAATQHAHQETETAWSSAEGFADAQTYRRFLGALATVHTRLGMPAATLRGADEMADEWERVHALANDLGHTPPPPPARGGMSDSFAWGVGYALNGAALGAAMMLKGGFLPPDWPKAYLSTGRDYAKSGRLARFFDALNDVGLDREEAARGARAVFDGLAGETVRDAAPPARDEAPLCTTA
ncbi:MAG: hypothetical protein AAGK00_00870 [Pseudomonadota bacterium]